MRKLSLLFLFATVFMISCNEDEREIRQIQVRLTDAPGDYEAVYIDLLRVEAHASGGNEQNGWFELNTNSGVYDLLKLTNGVDTLIVDDELPEGRITQIRLVLGNNNRVVIDGTSHALTIPSGTESGLKLNVNEDFLTGITYKVLLDFDAGRSVVKAGASGAYLLKPIIRTITEAQDGAIQGVIKPADISAAVMAIIGTDTIGTFTDEKGGFLLQAVPEGTYNVLIQPAQDYEPQTIGDVVVTEGAITEMDTVELAN